jgi:hypothetical protein
MSPPAQCNPECVAQITGCGKKVIIDERTRQAVEINQNLPAKPGILPAFMLFLRSRVDALFEV